MVPDPQVRDNFNRNRGTSGGSGGLGIWAGGYFSE